VTTEVLVAFAAASFALSVIPGPNVVYIITRGISQGRPAALLSTAGVEVGMFVHITAAAAGLSALVTRTAVTFTVVKVAAAAYLVYLAYRALRGGTQDEGDVAGRIVQVRSARRLVVQGFAVSALNPKVAIFFLAFLPQFVRPGAGSMFVQTLTLGLLFLLVATMVDGTYALMSASAGRRLARFLRTHANGRRYGEAVVYAGLGVTVLATGNAR